MREKKYIDRLYQEKFKDFEVTPREAVWKSISERLQEKERKKPIIPSMWSRVAGVAAMLALILLIGDWIFPSKAPSVANEDYEENIIPAEDEYHAPVVAIGPDKNSEETFPEQIQKERSAETVKEEKAVLPPSQGGVAYIETSILPEGDFLARDQKEIQLSEDVEKSLFDAIAEEKIEVVNAGPAGSFEISTHAAPIYYGNFGKGNLLNSGFDEGGQGEISFSYGVNVAYAVSDKIKIRSGVNMVAMNYNSNGIVYDPLVGPMAISGVKVLQTTTKKMPMANDAVSGKILRPVSNSEKSPLGSITPSSIHQKMGFIEIPVELEYNLIDRKFELKLIGGASTLFLDENSVSVESADFSAVGKAENLNEVSFSTNIGLGLDYNLSEKFKLNVEPMLKYQLNTFNSPSSETQPFYLGIYSGFSYEF